MLFATSLASSTRLLQTKNHLQTIYYLLQSNSVCESAWSNESHDMSHPMAPSRSSDMPLSLPARRMLALLGSSKLSKRFQARIINWWHSAQATVAFVQSLAQFRRLTRNSKASPSDDGPTVGAPQFRRLFLSKGISRYLTSRVHQNAKAPQFAKFVCAYINRP